MKAAVCSLTAVVLIVGLSATALAELPASRAEMRQDIQTKMILSALWDGELPWQDAQVLLQEQRVVDRWRETFVSDGAMTMREWRVLDYVQDVATRNIDRTLRRLRKAAREQTPPPAAQQVAQLRLDARN